MTKDEACVESHISVLNGSDFAVLDITIKGLHIKREAIEAILEKMNEEPPTSDA